MNNGLEGRYQSQLSAWNRARQVAAELREAFYNSGSIHDVLDRHDVSLPSLGELKNTLFQMAASSGHDLVDPVARLLYGIVPEKKNTSRGKVVA